MSMADKTIVDGRGLNLACLYCGDVYDERNFIGGELQVPGALFCYGCGRYTITAIVDGKVTVTEPDADDVYQLFSLDRMTRYTLMIRQLGGVIDYADPSLPKELREATDLWLELDQRYGKKN